MIRRAGTLHTPLLLQPPTIDHSPDGGELITWVTSHPAWGSVEPLRGGEYAGNVVADSVDVKITVRHNPEALPTARWRVVDQDTNVIYRVMAPLYDRDSVVLLCRTETGAGDGR